MIYDSTIKQHCTITHVCRKKQHKNNANMKTVSSYQPVDKQDNK